MPNKSEKSDGRPTPSRPPSRSACPANSRTGTCWSRWSPPASAKSQAVYANELKVSLSENFGQLQVRHAATTARSPRTYVKVYAEVNGRAAFYKDGYTDLRGQFDYASLSTDDLNGATRFAILVLSDEHGAVVKEAQPPRR